MGNYEKINNEFFNLNLPPAAKGYILCTLQYNLNKDEDSKQPIDMNTLTTYNVSELSKMYNMPISSVYKIEKLLKEKGILTVEQDNMQKRDQETGLVIQNRSVGLDKIGLEVYVLEALADHEKRMQEMKQDLDDKISKKEVEQMMEKMKKDILLQFISQEVEFVKED